MNCITIKGLINRYGHPHKEVLKRLKKEGSRILKTQEGGEVFITVRGETMEIGSLWHVDRQFVAELEVRIVF